MENVKSLLIWKISLGLLGTFPRMHAIKVSSMIFAG